MLKAMFAQRLMCLFTTADRAESIVGDLLEESRTHGRGWFVLQSARTASALCFKSVGVAVQDVTAAGEVFRRAVEMNLGKEIKL